MSRRRILEMLDAFAAEFHAALFPTFDGSWLREFVGLRSQGARLKGTGKGTTMHPDLKRKRDIRDRARKRCKDAAEKTRKARVAVTQAIGLLEGCAGGEALEFARFERAQDAYQHEASMCGYTTAQADELK